MSSQNFAMGLRFLRNITCALIPSALVMPSVALADDIDTCVEASELSQTLREAGQYLDAKKNLLICARDECPTAVRRDCLEELTRLEAAVPTVVFGVTGVSADRIVEVKVIVPGYDRPFGIDGKPVRFDPGTATVRFELNGRTVDKTVVLKAGDKNRAIDGAFDQPNQSVPDSGTQKPAPNWFGYSLVGLGALALGGSTWMWVRGRGDLSDLREGCGVTSTCDQAEVDSARTTILVGDILGGVGVVSIGLGAYFLLTDSTELTEGSMRVDAGVTDQGAGMSVSGTF